MAKAWKKKKPVKPKLTVEEDPEEIVVVPDPESEVGDPAADLVAEEKAMAEAAKDTPPPRPKGAPPPEDVKSEHVTKHGTVYRLYKPVKLSRGGMTRKIFIAHEGHEVLMRPCDRDYVAPKRY